MKRRKWERYVSMAAGCLLLVQPVSAEALSTENTTGLEETAADMAIEVLEPDLFDPWVHGYRFVDILNFSPESDPYSKQLRASIPLQERITPLAATQANPSLTVPARLYAISAGNYRSTDVNEAPWNGAMAYPEFSYNLFKFWQYTDMIGAGGRPTQGIEQGALEKEYGTVAIPIPAYINAAHKNGVQVLGEYFVPRKPQYTGEWIKTEDGRYPYAEKLLEIKEYYGFDGYFINQEEAITTEEAALLREMIQWMREQGCYIQWYDSILEEGNISYQNALNQKNAGWIWKDGLGRGADSIFLNYWYAKDALKESAALAETLGLDPYETVYMGVEGGQWKFDYNLSDTYGLANQDGIPYTSIAIWGSDFYHEQYNKPKNRYEVGYQWEAEERERMYFTGPTENVTALTDPAKQTVVNRSDAGVEAAVFEGMASYIPEHSVISGSVFSTDFNTGHGMQYWHEGELLSQSEWSNVNLQAILPTWQWWIESEDAYCLDMDWDYGPSYYRLDADGEKNPFAYEQKGAWTGGSSLVLYGELEKTQSISLYQTSLEVMEDSRMELVYWQPQDCVGAGQIQVALTFEDAPKEVVVLPIEEEDAANDWKKGTISLGAYAGRKIATIGFELSSESYQSDYQLNLGALTVTDGKNHTPATPNAFELVYEFEGNHAVEVAWEQAPYEEVPLYRLYAQYEDGTRGFLGGAYDDVYDIMQMEDADKITALALCAVGIDGTESEPAVLCWDQNTLFSDLKAIVTEDMLELSWSEAEGYTYASVEVCVESWYQDAEHAMSYQTVAETTAADIPVARMDGSQILVTLQAKDDAGVVIDQRNALFTLPDRICEAYDGELCVDETNGTFSLTTPSANDWYTAYVTIQGETKEYKRFGGEALNGLRFTKGGLGCVSVVLEDMDGNQSEPVSFFVENGVLLDPKSEYTETMIPDGALFARLREIVGPTLEDLSLYEGSLDLSSLAISYAISDLTGIELLSRVEEIDLSYNRIEKIRSSMFSGSVKHLILEGCADLKSIDLEKRPDISVELAGCIGLEKLEMNGAMQTTLDLRDTTKLKTCEIAGSEISKLLLSDASLYTEAENWDWQGARLTLTKETPEGQFASAFASQFEKSGLAPAGLEKGFFYGGQRPEILADWETPLEIKADGETHQLLEELEARFAACFLAQSNTRVSELENTDWIDPEYFSTYASMPSHVRVAVIAADGGSTQSENENTLGALLLDQPAEIVSVIEQGCFEGEEGIYLADGDASTKWCYGKESGYAVVELEKPAVIGAWKTIHAGSEAAGYISKAFRLQILNPEVATDEEYLAKSHSGKQSILRNEKAWVDLDCVANNTENEVMRTLSEEQLATAQIYRLQVDQAEQGAGGAIRIYELALYPYEGELGEDTNGLFCADIAGRYEIRYTKNGETIAVIPMLVTE